MMAAVWYGRRREAMSWRTAAVALMLAALQVATAAFYLLTMSEPPTF